VAAQVMLLHHRFCSPRYVQALVAVKWITLALLIPAALWCK